MIETKEQYEAVQRGIEGNLKSIVAVYELIEALRKVVRSVIVECERPENRGRMTQRQQADFLDSMRAAIKEALPNWITDG